MERQDGNVRRQQPDDLPPVSCRGAATAGGRRWATDIPIRLLPQVCPSLLPHSEEKCVSGVQAAREYEQVNIFRKKKYDPLSLFILIDDVDNTARWSNDLTIEVKYLSNIPKIISLK